MIKIVLLGVVSAFLAAWVKTIKAEYSLWIVAAAALIISGMILTKLEAVVESIRFIQEYFSAYGSYIKILIKIIGITYLAEISSDLCKDAGASVLASQIELFGKLSILVLCMPVLVSLLETIKSFLGG